MARIWVKGYTTGEGTRVKGHWRVVNDKSLSGKVAGKLKAEGLTFKNYSSSKARNILSKTIGGPRMVAYYNLNEKAIKRRFSRMK